MSNYHFGPYSSLTPRLQSSTQPLEKASSHTLSVQTKLQPRSQPRSPEGPKKSPTKNTKKEPKSSHETNFEGVLSPSGNKRVEIYTNLLAKNSRKTLKSYTGKAKKSQSPPKDPFSPNDEIKKSPLNSKPQVRAGDYESEPGIKHKSSSMKNISIPQHIITQQAYQSELVNWLNERSKTTKNTNINNYGGKGMYSSEPSSPNLGRSRGPEETSEINEAFEGSKKHQRFDSQSHRQSLDSNASVGKRSFQKQLSAFASQSEKRDIVPISDNGQVVKGRKNSKSHKDQEETSKRKNLQVSPRDHFKNYPYPLTTLNQNVQLKKDLLGSQSLRNSYNYDFQKDPKGQFRPSIDPSQNYHFEDQNFGYPQSAKNQTKPKDGFFQEASGAYRKGEKSAHLKNPSPLFTNEEIKFSNGIKSAKHSDPSNYNGLNNYMQALINGQIKRASDPQLQVHSAGQSVKSNFGLSSTGSGFGRFEHQQNFHPPTEETEYQNNEENNQKYYSNDQLNKGPQYIDEEMAGDTTMTKEIVSDLLQRKSSKDSIVNPNAKFLLMRKQIQEKKHRQNFKSADWSSPALSGQNPLFKNEKGSPGESSPTQSPISNQAREVFSSAKLAEDASAKAHLDHILQRTSQLIAGFKNKENTWEKEKKMLVAEIKYLRSFIEKLE